MKKINQISRQLLVDNNIPVTEPRLLFLEILLKNEGPLKIQEVIKFSKGKLAVSSLYRIINDLKGLNLINEFKTLENTKVIELVSLEGDHHHHVFCENCGAVYDFEFNNDLEKKLDKEIKNVESELNISVTSHSLELHGLCNNC
jgi:Fur family ferric uptake transcriptional regulator